MRSCVDFAVVLLLVVAQAVLAPAQEADRAEDPGPFIGGRPLVPPPFQPWDVAFAPDGRGFVFIHGVGRPEELWRASLDGGAPGLVVKPGRSVYAPAISPDGRTIAIVLRDPDDDSISDLYTVSASGGSLQAVAVTSAHERGPAWRPNGTLAFVRRLAPPTTKFGPYPAELVFTDAEGREVAVADLGAIFACGNFSPDDRAYVTVRAATDGAAELVRYAMPASARGRFSPACEVIERPPLPEVLSPAVSPRGRWVVSEVKNRDEEQVLYLHDLDSKRSRPWLAWHSAQLYRGGWTPDGRAIAVLYDFELGEKNVCGARLVPIPDDLAGSTPPASAGRVPADALLWLRWPRLSMAEAQADPRRMLDFRLRVDGAEGDLERYAVWLRLAAGGRFLLSMLMEPLEGRSVRISLVLRDLVAGGRRMLSSATVDPADPASATTVAVDSVADVAPDGKTWAVLRAQGGQARLVLGDLESGTTRIRATLPAGALSHGLAFSPDGSRLALESIAREGASVRVVPVAGDEPGVELRDALQPIWFPDGGKLLALRVGKSAGVIEYDPASGEQREVSREDRPCALLQWSDPGRTAMYLAAQDSDGTTVVKSVSIAEGEIREVVRGPIVEFAMDPGKHRMALLRMDRQPTSRGELVQVTGTVAVREPSGEEHTICGGMAIGSNLAASIPNPCSPRGSVTPRSLLWANRRE